MGAVTNVFRRGAVYYFRRRLRWPEGDFFVICVSLRTRRLDEARRRATYLAACCEKLRTRLVMLMRRQTLTPAQKQEIFYRQLWLERDALDALHGAVIALPYDGFQLPLYRTAFWSQVEAMEHVCREWIAHGWPDLAEFPDLESYVEAIFPGTLDDLERAY